MILLKEKVQNYHKLKNKFIGGIEKNFDDFYDDKHDDLNKIIGFTKYADDFIYELIQCANLSEHTSYYDDVKSKSLKKVLFHYEVDAYFNKSKADKWLVNALLLVVRDLNTFDGVMFTNGKDKVLKGNILKSNKQNKQVRL